MSHSQRTLCSSHLHLEVDLDQLPLQNFELQVEWLSVMSDFILTNLCSRSRKLLISRKDALSYRLLCWTTHSDLRGWVPVFDLSDWYKAKKISFSWSHLLDCPFSMS